MFSHSIVRSADGGTWHYGIQPDRFPTLGITTATGGHRTLQLTDGIVAYHTGPRRREQSHRATHG